MSRTDEEREEGMNRLPDRALWQRCRMADAPEDEAAPFLDFAAFAEGRLETDERDRVAALLAIDPSAAADVAAAQALAAGIDETPGGLDRVIARACAILPDLPDLPATPGRVVPFRRPREHRRILHGLTQWGSLAAAIAIASWLGFAMGSDASLALSQPGPAADASFLPDLLDPGTGLLRDLGEGLRR
jgi:anti-sigma factor RsiW